MPWWKKKVSRKRGQLWTDTMPIIKGERKEYGRVRSKFG